MSNTLTTNQIFGSLITYNRELAGVSLGALAAKLDITYQHLWDLENNHRTVTYARIASIIQTLGITPETFWLNASPAIKQLKKKISEKHLLNQTLSHKTNSLTKPVFQVPLRGI